MNSIFFYNAIDCSGNANISNVMKLLNTVFSYLILAGVVGVVIFSTLDLVKAIMAGKDEEIKKAQGSLIKKIIAVVLMLLIYLILTIVLDLVWSTSLLSDDLKSGVLNCVKILLGS